MAPLSTVGLAAFVWLGLGALIADRDISPYWEPLTEERTNLVRLLAVGDINLGRAAGQWILKGDTLYPFALVHDELKDYDMVFGNLECQLSDQKGETQHPRNNLIFTGPPAGAASLRKGGVTHVSTANNHALDYGVDALEETIDHLRNEGIVFSGTILPGEDLYSPALFDVNGIRFALFSCTDVMNREDRYWTRYVAEADSALLFPEIRSVRESVDFVFVSYHGGAEYSDRPSMETRRFAVAALESGADLFLGHHPHVPQGIEELDGKLIVYSLGNFVFYQPFAFWTQRSFALEAVIQKDPEGTRVIRFHCRPLIPGVQPQLSVSTQDQLAIQARLDLLSHQLKKGISWPN